MSEKFRPHNNFIKADGQEITKSSYQPKRVDLNDLDPFSTPIKAGEPILVRIKN